MTDNPSMRAAEARELSDSEYLRQLGVEPRFKRALGFFTGSLFAVAFQGPTTGALLITGGHPGDRRSRLHLGDSDHLRAATAARADLGGAELALPADRRYLPVGARQLGGDFLGWITGLFYVVAIVLVMPAVGTVMNVVLSDCSPA